MNRFKELDKVNSAPEELWTEVHNSVWVVVNKIILKKKKSKKEKWLSERALQIAEEQRDAKKQGREGKIHSIKCRILKNSLTRQEGLL